METLQNSLRNTAHSLASRENHRLIYTTAATAAVALLAYSRYCYVEWLALGEGGVPRSLRGWLFNVAAHLIARRDPRAVPAPYERKKGKSEDHTIVLSASEEEQYGAYSRVSFLSTPIPVRGATRPTVPTTVVPQRQTTEKARDATLARQNAYLAAVAAANPRLFAMKPSALESPRFSALWLLSPSDSQTQGFEGVDPARVKWLPRGACGETAHVHHEGSTHVCMSLVDAAGIVRKGWGERHRMSGVQGILPWGYVLVYAPREDGGDWEVWKEIALAAARAVAKCAGFDGEVVMPE
ncbi:hypothetical protein E0Z10_g8168 [Xylaria hypoxylon]|uniref:Luciferase domain-containing protein n=1 Tax=Xylaria hypoxylon TaxID=37992 RepID=A0A4Z0YW17_9PEZI|nr:hypothetical protein E0Z10_g8168 [Xylaria hypoxylon]